MKEAPASKYLLALPNPKNLIHALRDIGYSLETALADIIDNSITANATNININVYFDLHDSYISIVDNGIGMDEETLNKAMQLGSFDPVLSRERNDLGRFGLGLKTASFSQASKLTVVSKKNQTETGRCWDLDHVSETVKWEIEVLDEQNIRNTAGYEFLGSSGTLVLWENLYRLIDTDSKRNPEDIFWEQIDSVRRHLALTFHRYLTGEPGIKKIKIAINHMQIEPFDPFEGAGKPFPEENFYNIKMQAFLLPHHSKTTKEQYDKLRGPDDYLKSQGFYVYRNARLLVYGTWFRLLRQSEATKLARIKIDLPNSEDFNWSIDVKKSQAIPPEIIRQQLKRTIDKITSQASRVYTKRGKKISSTHLVPIWEEYHQHGNKSYKINTENPLIKLFINELDNQQKYHLKGIFELIENGLPIDTIYADMISEPENIKPIEIDEELLQKSAETYWEMLTQAGMEDEAIAKRMLQNEPFSKYVEFCENFIKHKQGIV
ncbi:MAG: ATP-binding protein [Sulfurovum sp.]|nr:ATP-binding protein [Sulfurovum sp.]